MRPAPSRPSGRWLTSTTVRPAAERKRSASTASAVGWSRCATGSSRSRTGRPDSRARAMASRARSPPLTPRPPEPRRVPRPSVSPARQAASPAASSAASTVFVGRVRPGQEQVRPQRPREEVRLVVHDGEQRADRLEGEAAHVLAVDLVAAGRRVELAGEDRQEGRLAAAVRSRHSHGAPRREVEVHRGQRAALAVPRGAHPEQAQVRRRGGRRGERARPGPSHSRVLVEQRVQPAVGTLGPGQRPHGVGQRREHVRERERGEHQQRGDRGGDLAVRDRHRRQDGGHRGRQRQGGRRHGPAQTLPTGRALQGAVRLAEPLDGSALAPRCPAGRGPGWWRAR